MPHHDDRSELEAHSPSYRSHEQSLPQDPQEFLLPSGNEVYQLVGLVRVHRVFYTYPPWILRLRVHRWQSLEDQET